MIAVLVMQAAVDQVIDMVAVWDSFMSATFSVNMARTGIERDASIGVGFIIGILQDSTETALNSSTDVLFTAAACIADEDKK